MVKNLAIMFSILISLPCQYELYLVILGCYKVRLILNHYRDNNMSREKISLAEIRVTRDSANLLPKSYKMHPKVCGVFDKMVVELGTTKIALMEKLIVEFWNKG